MATKASIERGSSSAILSYLLGDIEKYIQIMEKEVRRLIKKYPNKNLAPVFSILPQKLITIGPMALCDDLTQDLGGICSDDVLAAIGLSCLPITTHDDVVDETPKNRAKLAALVYAGNIAGLEGMNILFQKNLPKVAEAFIKTIAENHYRQQFRVDLLWEKKPKNFREYRYGIGDICSLAAIGPFCALTITGRNDLRKIVARFTTGYGVALQLIDDIREFDEDKLTSYTSFPLFEGKPFKKSFQEIEHYLKMAKRAIKPDWTRTRFRFKNLELFAQKIRKGFNGI